ncbi:hypothetical protein DICPUDRAFT_40956 [Dictyostelium purpureum]|uniref:Adenylate kinase active site lid domain-containing protein n=1 Tax=Dictyostelium purpureum TaxID=5786 RepID=F0ZZ46_DICPU|nr:uncharacterized protein DICPUDRAFT_40956 [Dictyostelium purpureum]EGC30779.1 hypothetical protein DICPUDRAFT_40956 [Dictyostelium purpureum]|eukprot:XP_003292695.1 hypothetical protein DICPUDRAFT_40956 [Dictyostelium purpureum]
MIYRGFSTSRSREGLRLTIIGAPGSGKGTQSEKLKNDYNVQPISTGQILREVSQEDSELGRSISSKLAAGELISNDIMLNIIEKALDDKSNWLLDGYPRNPEQAEHLDRFLTKKNIPLSLVLYLDVPEDVLAERVQDRWVHPGSGRVYNNIFSPPKVKGIDDVTGEPLVRRSDDKDIEVFKHRIDTFKQSTIPLLKYYESKGILYTIGSPNSTDGYVKIKEVLTKFIKTN